MGARIASGFDGVADGPGAVRGTGDQQAAGGLRIGEQGLLPSRQARRQNDPFAIARPVAAGCAGGVSSLDQSLCLREKRDACVAYVEADPAATRLATTTPTGRP